MQDPIYVAFATQKGGAGKSTLTTLVASYLHYVLGKRVLHRDGNSKINDTGRNFFLLYLIW